MGTRKALRRGFGSLYILHTDVYNPNQRQKGVSNGGSGVDKALRALRAVRAEGVWAHTQSAGGGGGGVGGEGGGGVEGGGGGGGLGTHWKPLNTS